MRGKREKYAQLYFLETNSRREFIFPQNPYVRLMVGWLIVGLASFPKKKAWKLTSMLQWSIWFICLTKDVNLPDKIVSQHSEEDAEDLGGGVE